MKIRIFELESQTKPGVLMKVFIDYNDTENPPHCHVRYDRIDGRIIGEFRVSLINAEILSDKNDKWLKGFLCKKDKDMFADKMKKHPVQLWKRYECTSWELACGLWDNGVPDNGLLDGKTSIPEKIKMPDYRMLSVFSE